MQNGKLQYITVHYTTVQYLLSTPKRCWKSGNSDRDSLLNACCRRDTLLSSLTRLTEKAETQRDNSRFFGKKNYIYIYISCTLGHFWSSGLPLPGCLPVMTDIYRRFSTKWFFPTNHRHSFTTVYWSIISPFQQNDLFQLITDIVLPLYTEVFFHLTSHLSVFENSFGWYLLGSQITT